MYFTSEHNVLINWICHLNVRKFNLLWVRSVWRLVPSLAITEWNKYKSDFQGDSRVFATGIKACHSYYSIGCNFVISDILNFEICWNVKNNNKHTWPCLKLTRLQYVYCDCCTLCTLCWRNNATVSMKLCTDPEGAKHIYIKYLVSSL